MRHCRSCENCIQDPICLYIKGIDYNQCLLDGHHIEQPFWEKCKRYEKCQGKKPTCSSWLYNLVEYVRKYEKKKR